MNEEECTRPAMKPLVPIPGEEHFKALRKASASPSPAATADSDVSDKLADDFLHTFEGVVRFTQNQRIPHGLAVETFATFLRQAFLRHTNKPDYHVKELHRQGQQKIWKISGPPNTGNTRVGQNKFVRLKHPDKLKQRMYLQATYAGESSDILTAVAAMFLSYTCKHGIPEKVTLGGLPVQEVIVVSRQTNLKENVVPILTWAEGKVATLIPPRAHPGVVLKTGAGFFLVEFAYEQYTGTDTGGLVVCELETAPPAKARLDPVLLMTQVWAALGAQDEQVPDLHRQEAMRAMLDAVMETIDADQKTQRRKKKNRKKKDRKKRKMLSATRNIEVK